MNCPSRTESPLEHPEWNQNPPPLNADLTTRQDLNGIANSREHKRGNAALEMAADGGGPLPAEVPGNLNQAEGDIEKRTAKDSGVHQEARGASESWGRNQDRGADPASRSDSGNGSSSRRHPGGHGGNGISCCPRLVRKLLQTRPVQILFKFARFIGPGFLIAVAYIDPGNYATDVSAGAQTKFALLFIVLMSNLFAIFLQSLCIKLGSVTGLNLAENCRAHLPKWLNIILYVFSEAAIIATDIAEVVGSAIALNLLFKIPLVAGCAITLVDVLVILIFYRPNGSMLGLRTFEFFVMALVLAVVICFCIQLSLIQGSTVGEVFRGYVPSAAVVESNGLYLSCGILGATVMPHSIFLGSGVVQSRLRQFDVANGYLDASTQFGTADDGEIKYRPSIAAIRGCLRYSIVELALSLFTFALFVNSSILIVAGASLSGNSSAADADLFGIHDLLSSSISPAAGTIFAIALLISGMSAGIVCTIAGQMVSEGMINWSLKPWLRRLITRSISIIPSIIIAGAVGKDGLNTTLTASQVVLSVILPFVTAPLIYFTSRSCYMTVRTGEIGGGEEIDRDENSVSMRNNWVVTLVAGLIWLVIAVMNVAMVVLVAMGKA